MMESARSLLRVRGLRNAGSAKTLASFTTLPIIDVGALTQLGKGTGTQQARLAIARQLDAACRNAGFFYVTNHGVPEEALSGVLQEARHWFQLPEHRKAEISIRPEAGFRGYQGMGTNVTRYDGGFQRDMHEALDLYREEDPVLVKAQGRISSPIHAQNQWPTQLPEFDAALRLYISHMLGLGEALMRGISLGLGLDEHAFGGGRAGKPYWGTRVIHYPPLHNSAESSTGVAADAATSARGGSASAVGEIDKSIQLSCGEHTDYGLLTLVNQDPGITALQVKNAAGDWITAPPIPGTVVCNIGDCLKFFSNGLYQSTAHRVINSDASRSRVSVPFFYEPDFEAMVEPIPQLCGDGHPKYPPLMYGTHLESKVLSNFEF